MSTAPLPSVPGAQFGPAGQVYGGNASFAATQNLAAQIFSHQGQMLDQLVRFYVRQTYDMELPARTTVHPTVHMEIPSTSQPRFQTNAMPPPQFHPRVHANGMSGPCNYQQAHRDVVRQPPTNVMLQPPSQSRGAAKRVEQSQRQPAMPTHRGMIQTPPAPEFEVISNEELTENDQANSNEANGGEVDEFSAIFEPYPAPPEKIAASRANYRGRAWSLYEEDRAIKHYLDVHAEGQTHGEARFHEAVRRLREQDKINRNFGGFKSFWNRKGRARSGLDERRNKNAPLATSKQGKAAKSQQGMKRLPGTKSGPLTSKSQLENPQNDKARVTKTTKERQQPSEEPKKKARGTAGNDKSYLRDVSHDVDHNNQAGYRPRGTWSRPKAGQFDNLEDVIVDIRPTSWDKTMPLKADLPGKKFVDDTDANDNDGTYVPPGTKRSKRGAIKAVPGTDRPQEQYFMIGSVIPGTQTFKDTQREAQQNRTSALITQTETQRLTPPPVPAELAESVPPAPPSSVSNLGSVNHYGDMTDFNYGSEQEAFGVDESHGRVNLPDLSPLPPVSPIPNPADLGVDELFGPDTNVTTNFGLSTYNGSGNFEVLSMYPEPDSNTRLDMATPAGQGNNAGLGLSAGTTKTAEQGCNHAGLDSGAGMERYNNNNNVPANNTVLGSTSITFLTSMIGSGNLMGIGSSPDVEDLFGFGNYEPQFDLPHND